MSPLGATLPAVVAGRRFSQGTLGEKLGFALLVSVYLIGVGIGIHDKTVRVGQPDPGFVLVGSSVSPTRLDAAHAGLAGGGRTLRINQVEVEGLALREIQPLVRRAPGESNTVVLMHPGGSVEEIQLPVRTWTSLDALYAEGVAWGLALAFVAVGVVSFLLRPWEDASWALLAMCTTAGALLVNSLVPGDFGTWHALFFRALLGVMVVIPFHAALTFPVVHPLLARHRWVLGVIYGLGLLHAGVQAVGSYGDRADSLQAFGMAVLLASVLVFIARCAVAAVRPPDRLSGQRARIILAGQVLGGGPAVAVNFIGDTLGKAVPDLRLAMLPLVLFLGSHAYVTVRHDLLNARVALQRAVIYAAVVVVLTIAAALLAAVNPIAVAALLFPVLYLWPRFQRSLDEWLTPKRAHHPEILRELGEELAGCTTLGEVLTVLAQGPRRLGDATTAVAFLPGEGDAPGPALGVLGNVHPGDPATLGRGAPYRLVATTRAPLRRERLAELSHIREESEAYLDRLGGAVLLVPLARGEQVIGALAVGPRARGDAWDDAESEALASLAQQAVQALTRIRATERLRERELEFADLKRFFPPQIIDQVMAKGGAAELRGKRKLVTVFFADLRGFTTFSETVEPEEVMATLAQYHDAMGRRIAAFSGTLERFAGDGFMVFFNDPVDQPDHVARALEMALAMREDVRRLRDGWSRKGYAIDVGMAIHTGYATCGFIGYEGRRDYAVIGNVTNLAARLSDAAKGSEILISARVHAELDGLYATETAGELELKGFQQPQPAHRLLGRVE